MPSHIIKNPEMLEKIKRNVLEERKSIGVDIKEKIMVCMGGGCIASGSQKVKETLEKLIVEKGLNDDVIVCGTGCLGPCVKGPIVLMKSDNTFYQKVTPEDCAKIISSHVMKGKVVEN